MEKINTVSILGCGWLGLPLAKALCQMGLLVKGSTTRPEKLPLLEKAGIKPFLLTLSPLPEGEGWAGFLDTEALIINIPPQTEKKGPDFHPTQIQALLEMVANSVPLPKIIFVSATSVYPDTGEWVTEISPALSAENTGNPALWQAEQLLRQAYKGDWLIVRLGGLLGYERIPGQYFAGKQNLRTGHIPVNFIHRDDAQAILQKLLFTSLSNEIFNAVSPLHPPRQVVYLQNAAAFGFPPPTFDESMPLSKAYKLVSGEKLQKALNYHFVYPDPLEYRYEKKII
ncbi:MAG: SDR family NAD(P)-dependent oxidoreductase [Microscillaceae bacterium]|nr:SDR family NAD(P)-dependent oxidoreductase [Microscillaceae bacterium]